MATDSEPTSETSGTPDPEISPNKRLKTLGKSILEFNEQDESPSPSTMASVSDTKVCGICLSEEGKSIRGFIDSCDHHFCFVCIMEWAKVETRCPLCKCRFSTIRRPSKDGVFSSDRTVNVPVRNQVYHYLGITTITDIDPYAEVQCSVCHSGADESLLLLCDLCDSAAHTYCVGLGATVPESDWFCGDCTVSRADHASIETDIDCTDQNISEKGHVMPSAESRVSIFDIVRDSIIPDRGRPPTIASSHPHHLSSLPNEATEPGARNVLEVADRVSEPDARTLRRCRKVHGRIRAFRENWNALQGGHLSFSSGSVDCGGKSSRKLNVGAVAVHSTRASHPHSSSSTASQQLAVQVNCSANTVLNGDTQDIMKAWKMMDIAKSIHQPTKSTLSNGNKPRDFSNIKSNCFVSRSLPVRAREVGSFAKNNMCHSLGLESEKHISQNYEKQKQGRVPAKEALKFNETLPTTHLGSHLGFAKNTVCHSLGLESEKHISQNYEKQKQGRVPAKEALKFNETLPNTHLGSHLGFAKNNMCHSLGLESEKHISQNYEKQKQGRVPAKEALKFNETLPTTHLGSHLEWPSSRKVHTLVPNDTCIGNVVNESGGCARLTSTAGSQTGASDLFHVKPVPHATSSCKVDVPRIKGMVKNDYAESKTRNYDNAKSEIQSLVKLNLKLLNRSKKLGVNEFKEVARLSTHSIMAACGVEHPKPGVPSFPCSVCCHSEQIQKLRKSTLMPGSCRECFYVFVKDVVNSILLEKAGHG